MIFLSLISKDINRLEMFQARIASWDGIWNNDAKLLSKELQDFIDEILVKNQSLFEYSIVLEGYLLLKSGPNVLSECSIRLGPLIKLAQLNKPLSSAAKWILGRIYCSQASLSEDLWSKYRLLNESFKMFSEVHNVKKIKYPLLLPGVKSEFSIKNLNYQYGEKEPCVFSIVIPNRYISAISLSCSDASFEFSNIEKSKKFQAKGISFLNEASKYCSHFSALNDQARLNNELLHCITESLKVTHLNQTAHEKNRTINNLIKTKEKINRIDFDVIPLEKTEEWMASIYASLAFVIRKGSEYESARKKMFENIESVASHKQGGIDFFKIDPIYRLANRSRQELSEFDTFIAHLNSKNIIEQAKMKEETKSVECEMNFFAPVTGVTNKNEGVINNISEQKQSIAEVFSEIERLLKNLAEENPAATESEQMAYVDLSTTPAFKQRTVAALKAGGESAIDELLLENKYVKIGKAILKGWLQANKA